jgi:hypothetical protein
LKYLHLRNHPNQSVFGVNPISSSQDPPSKFWRKVIKISLIAASILICSCLIYYSFQPNSIKIKPQPPLQNSNDICQNYKMKYICQENLGIPRGCMPQVKGETYNSFLLQKKDAGLLMQTSINASKLFFCQNEIDESKIIKKVTWKIISPGNNDPCNKPILVAQESSTSPFYVIDGHHSAAACFINQGHQKVNLIKESVRSLLSQLSKLNGIKFFDLKDRTVKLDCSSYY